MKKLKLTNAENSVKLQKKANTALVKGIGRDWLAAKAAAEASAKLQIKALNLLRDAGIKTQQASNHEHLKFEFWRSIENVLPKELHFKALKFCVHLARNFDKPIKTLDDARSASQMMFEAFGEATAPKRLEEQSAHEKNPWNDFVSTASAFTALFGELEVEKMEAWGRDRLTTFIRETEPIADAHGRAKVIAGNGK